MKNPPKSYKLPHPEPMDALQHARSGGIATFMRVPHIHEPEELDIALVGVPFDGGTTYRPGTRFGPRHVREQSVREISHRGFWRFVGEPAVDSGHVPAD